MGTPRMMIVLVGATALVVGAVAALALESWWILVAVVGVHALASAIVVGYAWKRAGQSADKPDPATEARLEEEGAADPGEGPRAGRTARDREVFN